jgi:hypothetical protein
MALVCPLLRPFVSGFPGWVVSYVDRPLPRWSNPQIPKHLNGVLHVLEEGCMIDEFFISSASFHIELLHVITLLGRKGNGVAGRSGAARHRNT